MPFGLTTMSPLQESPPSTQVISSRPDWLTVLASDDDAEVERGRVFLPPLSGCIVVTAASRERYAVRAVDAGDTPFTRCATTSIAMD